MCLHTCTAVARLTLALAKLSCLTHTVQSGRQGIDSSERQRKIVTHPAGSVGRNRL